LFAGGKNYFPLGTLQEGHLLYSNKPDDSLFVPVKDENRGADLVFLVSRADVLDPTVDEKSKELKVARGVFLEVKRMARVDLSGQTIEGSVIASPLVSVLRKPGATAIASVSEGQKQSPLRFVKTDLAARLPSAINVGTNELTVSNITLPVGGTASLRNKAFALLVLLGDQTTGRMQQGEYVVSELFQPQGQKMVQVATTPSSSGPGADPWSWAGQLGQFELVDATGHRYKPNGAWAKVQEQGQDFLVAQYNADSPVLRVVPIKGTPTDVYLAYLVPAGTPLRQFTYRGLAVQTFEQTAQ
jgi:hypothetical protein